jgi:hypothetical protein
MSSGESSGTAAGKAADEQRGRQQMSSGESSGTAAGKAGGDKLHASCGNDGLDDLHLVLGG